MILSNIENWKIYEAVCPRLKEFFKFVESHTPSTLAPGHYELMDRDLFVNVDERPLLPCGEQRLEVHRRYIDVQIPLSCPEIFGWSPLGALGASETPFDEERDIAFFSQKPSTYFKVMPQEFVVFFPNDAHAPLGGEGRIKKIIGKIRI